MKAQEPKTSSGKQDGEELNELLLDFISDTYRIEIGKKKEIIYFVDLMKSSLRKCLEKDRELGEEYLEQLINRYI